MKIQIIYVDMDGVLADFFKAVGILLNRPLPPVITPEGYTDPIWLGMPFKAKEPYIEKVGQKFWEELEIFPHAQELISLVSSYPRWEILTHPMETTGCREGKRAWLDQHFSPEVIAHMRGNKHELAHAGAVLIDDMIENVEKFRSAGGHGILFPKYYNATAQFSEDPVNYVRQELTKINES